MSRLEAIQRKVMGLEALIAVVRGWQVTGRKVVFTNGVFDIVHRGHVELLAQAAACGDRLVVAINADVSVKTLGKGDNRPVNQESDRALVIAAMQMVDAVLIFEDSTPLRLIETLLPDVLVKGGDYNPAQTDPNAKNYLVGAELQLRRGKEVAVIPLVEGYSTTSTIQKSSFGKN